MGRGAGGLVKPDPAPEVAVLGGPSRGATQSDAVRQGRAMLAGAQQVHCGHTDVRNRDSSEIS
ncbi:hypothetical protein JZ751_005818 [Albula glossodonta]|uniref:Uncharacterized protein n=1 Tax=Albula glossodonta TaxID=121402 RepID=A0A8T2P6I7_9TELE|nr:hypothetical protein JZ751_005818 [Albula glossodonta]